MSSCASGSWRCAVARAPFRERPEFLRGRSVELLVSDWLKGRGWYVIPSYDYSGDSRDKAPRLSGLADAFPVPDLDVCRALPRRTATRRWVEVKAKEAASYTRKTDRYEHGIEHYDDYVKVAELTGTEPWLAICELTNVRERHAKWGEAGALLMQSFERLGPPRRTTMYGKRMAYWDRLAFMKMDVLALPEHVAQAA